MSWMLSYIVITPLLGGMNHPIQKGVRHHDHLSHVRNHLLLGDVRIATGCAEYSRDPVSKRNSHVIYEHWQREVLYWHRNGRVRSEISESATVIEVKG